MSTEQDKVQNEDLNKSIDTLLDDIFSEDIEKASAIDIAGDAKTNADAAVGKVPKGQKDEARGAGRPKQISDVPQVDMDGSRDGEYDAKITENENKESEPDEAKKQAKAIDQVSKEGHKAGSSKAPASRPFKKSENGESEEISDEEYKEFQEFKKSKVEAAEAEELKKAEDLKKADEEKQETLIKSAVSAATDDLRKSMDTLQKTNTEQAELLKAMAGRPQRPKSVVGIEQLEKSQDPDLDERSETFTKSQMLDAAEELYKSKEIPMEAVVELDNTGTVYDPHVRKLIEKKLQG